MEIPIKQEFRAICKEIKQENKTSQEWAEVESDDMFQSDFYCGGYDADEMAFCFSYYGDKEYWFQFTLEEAIKIASDESVKLFGEEADK